MDCFLKGYMNVATGTSLRSFLAEKLCCSPMRVSKKLSLDMLAGIRIPKKLGQKRYFMQQHGNSKEREHAMNELQKLEAVFLDNADDIPITSHRYECTEIAREQVLPMRIGYWSQEEQEYAWCLIDYFLKGILSIRKGTTLRSFLAEKLCCNPMRVSKKLATGWIADHEVPKKIGTATYFPNEDNFSEHERIEAEKILAHLHRLSFTSNSCEDEIKLTSNWQQISEQEAASSRRKRSIDILLCSPVSNKKPIKTE